MRTIMDLKQLRYFMAIVEERQITAAARRLHMAQPPLSNQMKMLEQSGTSENKELILIICLFSFMKR